MSAEAEILKLLEIHPKGFDLSLGRVSALLEKLGNPHLKIPPVFHIAGTNGKGSTTAFLRAIIEASDRTTHVHTSPHLVDWAERYRLGKSGGGKFVTDKKLEKAVVEAATANAGTPITVFEIMSAVAFLLFSENQADYSILEVGLGGRFDATNVIAPPMVSIITPIGLDHQSYLGDTIEKIAFEKAGIIKKNTPVIVGPQQDSARDIIEKVAQENQSKIWFARQDFDGYVQRGRFIYQDEYGLLDMPLPKLKGEHQITNAANAIAATRITKLGLSNSTFETAMENVSWVGRFERLPKGKLSKLLTKDQVENFDIWIDGGHNPQAGAMLGHELKAMKLADGLPLILICGMLTTKDPSGFFGHFKNLADQVITIPITQSESAFTPNELKAFSEKSGLKTISTNSIEEALLLVSKNYAGDLAARIMICGSLYLVGEVLDKNGTHPK